MWSAGLTTGPTRRRAASLASIPAPPESPQALPCGRSRARSERTDHRKACPGRASSPWCRLELFVAHAIEEAQDCFVCARPRRLELVERRGRSVRCANLSEHRVEGVVAVLAEHLQDMVAERQQVPTVQAIDGPVPSRVRVSAFLSLTSLSTRRMMASVKRSCAAIDRLSGPMRPPQMPYTVIAVIVPPRAVGSERFETSRRPPHTAARSARQRTAHPLRPPCACR